MKRDLKKSTKEQTKKQADKSIDGLILSCGYTIDGFAPGVRGCVVLFSFALLLLLFCLCLQKPSPPHPAPQRGHASHNALQPAAAKHVSLWKKSSRCDVINCGLHTATL